MLKKVLTDFADKFQRVSLWSSFHLFLLKTRTPFHLRAEHRCQLPFPLLSSSCFLADVLLGLCLLMWSGRPRCVF
jgi:hypothetical protein